MSNKRNCFTQQTSPLSLTLIRRSGGQTALINLEDYSNCQPSLGRVMKVSPGETFQTYFEQNFGPIPKTSVSVHPRTPSAPHPHRASARHARCTAAAAPRGPVDWLGPPLPSRERAQITQRDVSRVERCSRGRGQSGGKKNPRKSRRSRRVWLRSR